MWGGLNKAPFLTNMDWINLILLYIKYIMAIMIVVAIVLAPAWLARQTKKNKTATAWIRIYSWLFGWTGIGWLVALYMAVKK